MYQARYFERKIQARMAQKSNLIADLLSFVKSDLNQEIEDPISSRPGDLVQTSFPQTFVKYPIIIVKHLDQERESVGFQTSEQNIEIILEIRIYARNEKHKDNLSKNIFNRLSNIKYTDLGSIDSDFRDFKMLSFNEIDAEGQLGIKSRILQIRYRFFNN